jgi:hypothetical protein
VISYEKSPTLIITFSTSSSSLHLLVIPPNTHSSFHREINKIFGFVTVGAYFLSTQPREVN